MQLSVRILDSDPRLPARLVADRRKLRNGGKPPHSKLLKPIRWTSKRALFLRWFLEDEAGRTVGATMAAFRMSRPNVFAHWTALREEHGIGYRLEANTIIPRLPPGVVPAAVFDIPFTHFPRAEWS